MKRSEINGILKDAISFIEEMNFKLPPFAYWTPEDWERNMDNPEYREIRENCLGWDITDFGHDRFHELGLFLFTIRNGNYFNPSYEKPYAEKIMVVAENQITPFHYHQKKLEDIINRGGGNLMLRFYNAAPDNSFADTPVRLQMDGRHFTVEAGSVIRLKPGESVTMTRGLYHSFWGEEGTGKVMVGEVSMTNDDHTDNIFHDQMGRFPEIIEDCKPLHLLCIDYEL